VSKSESLLVNPLALPPVIATYTRVTSAGNFFLICSTISSYFGSLFVLSFLKASGYLISLYKLSSGYSEYVSILIFIIK
jgi:hypothetical protein